MEPPLLVPARMRTKKRPGHDLPCPGRFHSARLFAATGALARPRAVSARQVRSWRLRAYFAG
ncbi:hypothetical protein C2L80_00845 [Rubneribacter badeniensis]|uniref:Uncharacterized protein n=1 Tax=Rubneribacter badeniensis TaxID=2070688 RepID=A0A2K2U825_9ACTN|nr:hypothetical protein C2L80_00845 [Rubneribacter badeniensis]CVH76254.1 hypothetical protein BN3658_00641 [Coriobacteriaceae bacterium CHKCI002]